MKLQATAETVWRMSFPLVLCGLGDTIVEVTDTILLARFGVIELGAVALAAAIYETTIFMMFGVRDGIQIITARRAGQAREKAIGEAFRQGITTLLATAVVVFLVLKFVSPHVMELALRSGNVAGAVNGFLGIVAFRVFFDALNFPCRRRFWTKNMKTKAQKNAANASSRCSVSLCLGVFVFLHCTQNDNLSCVRSGDYWQLRKYLKSVTYCLIRSTKPNHPDVTTGC